MERTPKQKFEAVERTAQPKRRRTEYGVKKDTHNKCEQKGRQKINDKINELKDLLPECQTSAANKAAILRSAADSIKRFQFICYQLFASNMKLDEENGKIRDEIIRLKGIMGIPIIDTNATANHEAHRVEANIKPELVDPARFISSNHMPMRQPQTDSYSALLYANAGTNSYKTVPNNSLFLDTNQYSSSEDGDEKDPSSSPEDSYTWK